MATKASVCSALLKWFRSKEDDFLSRLVTVDETWVHYYEPENKAQNPRWVGPGPPRPKKLKTQPSAGKVMVTVFWDAQGIIMLGFLAKKSTITGAYYANCLTNWELRSVKNAEVNSPKDSAPTGQCKSPHLQNCNGCCWAEWVRANTSTRLFSGLSS